MALVLNEEQNMLRDAAKDFCSKNTPITALRKLRDNKDETGFDKAIWKQMADLGWAGITIPEEFGGLEFGYVGLGVVMEECGRTLAASPLMSTAVLGSSAIQLAGSAEQKSELLPLIAAGELITAFALEEGAHHAPYTINTSAKKAGDGYTLTGSKKFVLDGHVADTLIVVARTSGDADSRQGISFFLVDRKAKGLTVTRTIMADSRNAANIELKKVPATLLGKEGSGSDVIDQVLDIGRAAISAEMLGSTEEAFERTVEYLKTREQFGAPIGSFQALKHRAADMFCEIELSKSAVLGVLSALDDGSEEVPQLASLAKARLTDTYNLVSSEAIQMHGGIGMTDEHEIGFFIKRARLSEHTLGNAAWHRNRYGELEGY